MKKILVVSDSFKGTLTSEDIVSIWKEEEKSHKWPFLVETYPVADGGEGTCLAFSKCLKGSMRTIETLDANGNRIKASYFVSGETAIIEVASCIGLPNTKIKDPSITTSEGVGLLLLDAIKNGAKKIILGLGGSSTNDAGAPIANVLGARFYDENGVRLTNLSGKELSKIARVDLSSLHKTIEGVEIIGMCDVNNPLCGRNGASYVYGPQKGADLEAVKQLDESLHHYASVITQTIRVDLSSYPGAGAAGGIGFSVVSLLNGKLISGIDVLLDAIGFDDMLEQCDLVVSGEGRLDNQSFSGKVIDGINKRCQKEGKDLSLIVGSIGDDISLNDIKRRGITDIEVCSSGNRDFEEIKTTAKEDYRKALNRLIERIE